jgi:lipid II:glycine glycyltransferase (peptidoglycan interpeptide bridge formation enzyme)
VDPAFLDELGYGYTPLYTSILYLEKEEKELFGNIHPYARNRIRKAEKSGVEIIKDGRPYLGEYYEMVKETLGSQGIRVNPKEFYEKVLDRLEPMGRAKLFIAMYKGNLFPEQFFFYKESVYYWHGASFREYLPIAPSQLIHWELIRYAHQNGYKVYDFLNIEPERLPGIARFKMRFGGETKTYYRAFRNSPFIGCQ